MSNKFFISNIFIVVFSLKSFGQIEVPYIKSSYPDLPAFDNNARLLHCKYWSAIWKEEIGYLIYLPKDYYTYKDTIFPVLFYLQGYSGNYTEEGYKYDSWHESMDKYFPQTVIVTANSMQDNFYDGDVEQSIIKELIPHIISTFRVSDQKECTAIAGFSMGGHGAIKFALKYSHLFSQALSLSGGDFSEIKSYINEYKTNGTGELEIRVTVGNADNLALGTSRSLKKELETAEIPFYYKEYGGLSHDSKTTFTDSLISTETFSWQADNFLKTCPVAVRNATLPAFTEKELPYVNEYNPFGATPKPVMSFKVDRDSISGFYLSWGKNFRPATGYIIQHSIYKEYDFTTVDTVSNDQYFYTDSLNLICNTKHDYRIIAFNGFGNSMPVYHPSVDLFCTSIKEKSLSDENIDIFPNPSKGHLIVKLEPGFFDKHIKLSLYDIYGKEIVINTELNQNQIFINTTGLKGIYLISVISNNKLIKRQKIIILP